MRSKLQINLHIKIVFSLGKRTYHCANTFCIGGSRCLRLISSSLTAALLSDCHPPLVCLESFVTRLASTGFARFDTLDMRAVMIGIRLETASIRELSRTFLRLLLEKVIFTVSNSSRFSNVRNSFFPM